MKNVTPINETKAPLAQAAWDSAVFFHGHACPGLAVGCRLALAAVRALGIDDSFLIKPQEGKRVLISPDEELVCVSETDACGVDAVQSLLGCTLGKGNLLFHPRGKSAMSFYHRPSGRAVRVLWTAPRRDEDRESHMRYYLQAPEEELIRVQPLSFAPPPHARISASVACAACGEITSEAMTREVNGKPYCLDCVPE